AQGPRRVQRAQFLQLPQDKNRTVLGRQRFQTPEDGAAEFFSFHKFKRGLAPLDKLPERAVSASTQPSALQRFIKMTPVFAQFNPCFVDCNLGEPRAEFTFIAKLNQVPKCL